MRVNKRPFSASYLHLATTQPQKTPLDQSKKHAPPSIQPPKSKSKPFQQNVTQHLDPKRSHPAKTAAGHSNPVGNILQGRESENPTVNTYAKIRNHAPSIIDPYIAYGACDSLMKECSRQADYTIPQLQQKDAPVLKTSSGEDLGVGKGWWYESESPPYHSPHPETRRKINPQPPQP